MASPSFSVANNCNSWQATAFILRSIDAEQFVLAKSMKSASLISSRGKLTIRLGNLYRKLVFLTIKNKTIALLTIKKIVSYFSKLLFTVFNRQKYEFCWQIALTNCQFFPDRGAKVPRQGGCSFSPRPPPPSARLWRHPWTQYYCNS